MTGKTITTWILIADGEHARVVVPIAGHRFHTINSLDSVTAHQRSADLGTERPGRSHESASPTRHAIEPKTDPHRAAEHAFVHSLAGHINEAAAGDAFGRLILVAPPRALQALREALGGEAGERLGGTLAKDLVKVPDAALTAHLEEFWHPPPEVAT